MKTEKAIENILKEQLKSYRALNDLLNDERDCLLNIDGEKVEGISKEKDTVVMRLRLLEEERQRLMKKYTDERGTKEMINLKGLAELTGNQEFFSLRSELTAMIQSIDEKNKINSILIERSLRHIKTTANFFSSFFTDNEKNRTGVLLSKET